MRTVRFDTWGSVAVVTIDRPDVRNAVNAVASGELVEAFERFDREAELSVAILTGANGTFCSGFDLEELVAREGVVLREGSPSGMGPARMLLSKPVLAAVEGCAVGGGFELALWCDLRIAASDAVFGVFNRRLGVPLVDLGTVRLPRVIGHGRALDLILTGRAVGGEEALAMGLVNRLVEPGQALPKATELAQELSRFPQAALRGDRLSAYEQWALPQEAAVRNELRRGLDALASGEALAGAKRFSAGAGRHGSQVGPGVEANTDQTV